MYFENHEFKDQCNNHADHQFIKTVQSTKISSVQARRSINNNSRTKGFNYLKKK